MLKTARLGVIWATRRPHISILYPVKDYRLPMRRAQREKLMEQENEQKFPPKNEPAYLGGLKPNQDDPGDIFR